MPDSDRPQGDSEFTQRSLAPIGKLGFRGRSATPEERAAILDSYFFEGPKRTPYLQQYFVLMLLSATIAGLGLTNNSAAVVIGAMLVAPLMTPILATAAAIVQGWWRRAGESLAIVGAGALVAIGVGLAISLIAPTLRTGLPLPGELLARTGPNLVDLGIAIAAGAAGGFVAVRSEASGALPGVGIAVALVPPLATVGITLGLGDWDLALGALLLFATNLVAIVLAAGLVFIGAGFAAYRDAVAQRQARYARIAVTVGVILVAIPLATHSWQRLTLDNALATTAQHAAAWAPEMTLQGIDIDRSEEPIRVTISVTGPEAPPRAMLLAERLAVDFDRDIHVDVVYVPVDRATVTSP